MALIEVYLFLTGQTGILILRLEGGIIRLSAELVPPSESCLRARVRVCVPEPFRYETGWRQCGDGGWPTNKRSLCEQGIRSISWARALVPV